MGDGVPAVDFPQGPLSANHHHRLNTLAAKSMSNPRTGSYVTFVPDHTISIHHSKREITNKPAREIPSIVQRLSKVSRKQTDITKNVHMVQQQIHPSKNKNQDQIADTHADILTEIQQPTLRHAPTSHFFPITVQLKVFLQDHHACPQPDRHSHVRYQAYSTYTQPNPASFNQNHQHSLPPTSNEKKEEKTHS
jgi:hypothetical protein